jgi:hypothetical protein
MTIKVRRIGAAHVCTSFTISFPSASLERADNKVAMTSTSKKPIVYGAAVMNFSSPIASAGSLMTYR